MAVIKAARKSIRQNKRRRATNTIYRDKMKDLIKQIRFLISEKKNDEAEKMLPQVYKILDKSAKVGVIKKNTASRRKSRLTKLIAKKIN